MTTMTFQENLESYNKFENFGYLLLVPQNEKSLKKLNG